MKYLSSIRGSAVTVVVIRSIMLVLEIASFIMWEQPIVKPLLTALAILFFGMVFIDIVMLRRLQQGELENQDERDRILMWKAADQAITYSQVIYALIVLLALLVMIRSGGLSTSCIVLALVAITLPPLVKNAVFLYLEANDEGEVFE